MANRRAEDGSSVIIVGVAKRGAIADKLESGELEIFADNLGIDAMQTVCDLGHS